MVETILAMLVFIRAVESSNGQTSANEYQITPVCVRDVNRIYGTAFTIADTYDRRASEEICVRYLLYWSGEYERKTGMPATEQVLARMWNGGPNGWKKPQTARYWRKIKREIDKSNYTRLTKKQKSPVKRGFPSP